MIDQLETLIGRGRRLRETLAVRPDGRALGAFRSWQQDCAALVLRLSGGSKAHWVARAYSDAFLLRSASGSTTVDAPASEILDRIVAVLERARAALSQTGGLVSSSSDAPRRFEFVHDAELRAVLEHAYNESRAAFDERRFDLALVMSCGILEALLTDALGHHGLDALKVHNPPGGTIADWPFAARAAVAERAGLIRGGCARLPPIAWRYRDLTAKGELRAGFTVSEREARVTGQVLRVVMRDLDPGR